MLNVYRVSMRKLMRNKFVVRATGWTTLRFSFMQPEPHDGCVVLLTYNTHRQLMYSTHTYTQMTHNDEDKVKF